MTDLFLQRDLTVAKRLREFNGHRMHFFWPVHRWAEVLKLTLNYRVIQWLGERKALR